MFSRFLYGGIGSMVTTCVGLYMMDRVPEDDYDDKLQLAKDIIASWGTGFAVGAITTGALVVLDDAFTDAFLQLTK